MYVTRVPNRGSPPAVLLRESFYMVEDVVECWLLNAQHLKKVPGRKTDVSDSEWIAELVAHGLVRPSFVPPPGIRRLRDLTRYRTALTQDRTREIQRLQNVLEDAGIKLDCVASDIMGKSARAMLAALIRGERDPQVLAELALGRMRPKVGELQQALVGRFGDHHARLCSKMLAHIDDLTATIDELTGEIGVEIEPFQCVRKRLRTIPGVSDRLAENLIAETGGDMNRFPTPQQRASWAGICPGNNESAGKHFSGRTRKGNRWLRGALGEAAAAAARTKGTYLSARYRVGASGVTFLARWPANKAMQHARDRIRELTERRRLRLSVDWVADLNRFLRGWSAYFRYGNSADQFVKISRYARMRIALFVSKRHRRSREFGWYVVAFASPNQLGLIDLTRQGTVAAPRPFRAWRVTPNAGGERRR